MLRSYTRCCVYVVFTVAVFFFLVILRPARSTLFPYTTLFRSRRKRRRRAAREPARAVRAARAGGVDRGRGRGGPGQLLRSEEHTSELQSLTNLVCRLLLEKKKSSSVTFIEISSALLLRGVVAP